MTKPEVTVEELTVEQGQALFEEAFAASTDDHDSQVKMQMLVPFARRSINWPVGRWDLRRLKEINIGDVLCPVEWESGHLAGTLTPPWVTAVRSPFTLRVLGPGETQWRWETKVTCRTPDDQVLYYTGAPGEYVRVILPEGGAGRDDDVH